MDNKDVAVYGPGPANRAVGIGNNTMLNNNPGGAQIVGNIYALFPNLCQPTAC